MIIFSIHTKAVLILRTTIVKSICSRFINTLIRGESSYESECCVIRLVKNSNQTKRLCPKRVLRFEKTQNRHIIIKILDWDVQYSVWASLERFSWCYIDVRTFHHASMLGSLCKSTTFMVRRMNKI